MPYKRTFLSDVIFRIDFPLQLKISESEPVEFQNSVSKEFPILEPIQAFEIKISQNPVESIAQNKSNVIWTFSTKDRATSIDLQNTYLAIKHKNYQGYNNFKELVSNITSIFFKVYGEVFITRLGLRYINQVKTEGKDLYDWSNYLSADLVKYFSFFDKKTDIRRAMNHIEIFYPDDIRLIFKYGIFNSSYPEKLTSKEFLLDYDCYTRKEISSNEVVNSLEHHHNLIKEQFEKSINDGFKELLNKE